MEKDSELIKRIKKGETALYERLMRKYNQRLYRIARSIIREEMEVEDVLQETYLKAFVHLKNFEGRSEFSTWLTSILINQAHASVMKKKKQQRMAAEENYESESLLNIASPQQDNPEQQIMNQELKKYLEKAIDELPDKLRTVYMMREVEGLPMSETAQILQLSPENVRVRLHRAKALLKEKLYKEAEVETTVFRFGEERCDKLVRSVMRQLHQFYPALNERFSEAALPPE